MYSGQRRREYRRKTTVNIPVPRIGRIIVIIDAMRQVIIFSTLIL